MKNIHVIRLLPGDDLKLSLETYVKQARISAGWLVTCVGSLTEYQIRFAGQHAESCGSGRIELININGTLSRDGIPLHIAIADQQGKTTGGHLLSGCKIYTTAEIVLQTEPAFVFSRKKDGTTDWAKLQIKKNK